MHYYYQRIDHLFSEPFAQKNDYYLHHRNLTDTTNLLGILKDTKPDEKYNLVESLHTFSSNRFVNYSIIRFFSLFWPNSKKIKKSSFSLEKETIVFGNKILKIIKNIIHNE